MLSKLLCIVSLTFLVPKDVDEIESSLVLPEVAVVIPKPTRKRSWSKILIIYWCSILLLLATTFGILRPNKGNPAQATMSSPQVGPSDTPPEAPFSVVDELKLMPKQDHLAVRINDTIDPAVPANRTEKPLHYGVNDLFDEIIDEEDDAICPLHNPVTTLYPQEHQVCLLRKHPLVKGNVYSFARAFDFTIDLPSMPSQYNPFYPIIKDSIPKQYRRIFKMGSTEAISVLLIIASFVSPGIEMPLWVRQTVWMAPRAVMVQALVFRLIDCFLAFHHV